MRRLSEKSRISPIAEASGRFKGFKPESERTVREIDLKKDEKLEELIHAWKSLHHKDSFWGGMFNKGKLNYLAEDRFKGLELSAVDVEGMSLALAMFQDEPNFPFRAATFLNALMFRCPERSFTLHTAQFSAGLQYLGWYNSKDIAIIGDVGNELGREMEGGSIIVHGNAGHQCGALMNGGKIEVFGNAGLRSGYKMTDGAMIIHGNAGNETGMLMEGGVLIVKGRAGFECGDCMLGGEIRLEGGYDGITDNFNGGKIFHEEYLIREGWYYIKKEGKTDEKA
jgi:hypothetical protein